MQFSRFTELILDSKMDFSSWVLIFADYGGTQDSWFPHVSMNLYVSLYFRPQNWVCMQIPIYDFYSCSQGQQRSKCPTLPSHSRFVSRFEIWYWLIDPTPLFCSNVLCWAQRPFRPVIFYSLSSDSLNTQFWSRYSSSCIRPIHLCPIPLFQFYMGNLFLIPFFPNQISI